jgi:microcystin-dependent protein
MEGIMGMVVCIAGSYVPKCWAACDGQTLLISKYPKLFKVLGTTYGGNGVTTFNLPDLRGRTAVSTGQSSFHNYKLGEQAGAETLTLTTNHIPAHTHDGTITLHLSANADPGIDAVVNGGFPSDYTGAYSATGGSTMLSPDFTDVTIGNTGSGLPVNTRSPYLAITYIICVEGIFPPRP